MELKSNSKRNSSKYDDITIVEIWKKAIPFSQFELYKKDLFGSVMFFDEFGIESEMGWGIGSVKFKKEDAEDNYEDLQPVHWKNLKKLEKDN